MPLAYHTNTALQNCAFCHILLACIVSQRQHQKSRSTGHGNAWTRPDSTGADEAPASEADADEKTRRQHQRQSRPEIKARSGTPEEPKPARRQQRHDRQQTASTRRAAEIEPEPESQKRGTVGHEQRQTETERRIEKSKREGPKRQRQCNAAFLPVSPNAQQINRQSQPSTGRHGQQQKCRLFRFCFCGVCGTNGDQRQF